MGFYVQILAVALSNVMAYVANERQGPRVGPSTFGSADSPDKSQPESMLEKIIKAMMALHSRICKQSNPCSDVAPDYLSLFEADTRAAHLERSRTKAVLSAVAFRVYYQRLASSRGTTATGKPRNLLQYFNQNG
jgi:hypothetical protein